MNDERLLLEWLVSGEEIEFVIAKSRGTENRLKYALQICCLKQTGRFIDDWSIIPINILNHLSKQLEIDLVHSLLTSGNKNSESKIRQEAKLLLGFKDFDFKNDTLISNFLEQNPLLISNKNEITREVENFLIKAKIYLPSKNQLMRYVYSQYGKTQIDILENFSTSINDLKYKSLKRIYEENILLPEIKKPIGEVNIKNITLKIEIIEALLKLNLESLP